jgi:hypothetical protein
MTDKPKHPGGRPTKYKEEFNDITKYVKQCEENEKLVSLCGYAVYLDVCEETLQEWKRVHPQFSVSLEKIKQLSKEQLINNGLISKYSPNMAKFVLSANHGMRENTGIDHTTDGKPITPQIVVFGKNDDTE